MGQGGQTDLSTLPLDHFVLVPIDPRILGPLVDLKDTKIRIMVGMKARNRNAE